jgi:CRISPR-associated protein Cas1
MAHRIVDISSAAARLRSSLGRLIISRDGTDDISIPFSEIVVVVLGHPQVTLTQPVLAGLAEAGAVLIACDVRRLPCAMQVPLVGHFVQTERIWSALEKLNQVL